MQRCGVHLIASAEEFTGIYLVLRIEGEAAGLIARCSVVRATPQARAASEMVSLAIRVLQLCIFLRVSRLSYSRTSV
jgi:hypothetical protein